MEKMALAMELFDIEIKLTKELILTAGRGILTIPPPSPESTESFTPEPTPPPTYSQTERPTIPPSYSLTDRPAIPPVQPVAPLGRHGIIAAAMRERIRLQQLEENWD